MNRNQYNFCSAWGFLSKHSKVWENAKEKINRNNKKILEVRMKMEKNTQLKLLKLPF